MTIDEMNERKRELGYTDMRISEISGVPLSTVRKVLGGTTKAPRYETIRALTKALEKPYKAPAIPPHTVREPQPAYGSGVIYDMSSPLGHHQIIAGQIHADLLAYISRKGGPCIPFIAPVDVQLDCDDKTIVQPDVMILCDRSKYTPQRIVGAPDFVVEVLSKSTKKKDMYIKMNKYKFAGVREYWLVDPDRKTIVVYDFENDDAIHMYSFRDKVPVGIYNGDCMIDFAPIDDFVSQLPH